MNVITAPKSLSVALMDIVVDFGPWKPYFTRISRDFGWKHTMIQRHTYCIHSRVSSIVEVILLQHWMTVVSLDIFISCTQENESSNINLCKLFVNSSHRSKCVLSLIVFFCDVQNTLLQFFKTLSTTTLLQCIDSIYTMSSNERPFRKRL